MSDIAINYKGSSIATMDASGTKTLLTSGKYCEDDIEIAYTKPSAPAPTLQSKTYTVDSAGTETITADSGYDGLSSVAVSVPSADPYVYCANPHFFTEGSSTRKWNITPETVVDVGEGDAEGWLADGFSKSGTVYEVNAVPSNTSVTPTESAQTIGGANYMMEGAVTVNAIPSNYVGSGITQRSSSDLTASGATVTVPSGYYSSNASKAVASGTAGTPTATKGTVSNHSISVTPSVTNTTGYITGSTKTGTAVTVSASELVSGSETKTANGTYDVTNLASIIVNVAGGGGGGLVYETGTWTPSADVASYVIPFANTHTTAPFYYTISDATGTHSSGLASTNYGVIYVCWNQIFGAPMYSTSSQIWYGRSNYLYRGTSATAAISAGVSSFTHSESETGTSDLYPTYWATETGIKAYTNSSSRYWRAGRTYKWIAVWKPTT